MIEKIKSYSVLVSFITLILMPQALRAETSTELKNCLNLIKESWGSLHLKTLRGSTRHQTDCQVEMKILDDRFELTADGEPLEVSFQLGKSENWSQKIQSCKVDKEKLHIVFEQKSLDSFERKEKIQMTLLKRKNKDLSLILSEKQIKVFMPLSQANLICHLQPEDQRTAVQSP